MSLLRRDQRRVERVSHRELSAMVEECKERGGLFSLQPLLGSLLKLKGKPYGLERHFMFEPFFMAVLTGQLLLKCARQVGKSATAGAKSVAITAALEYFNTLHVTPLFEQIKRFSHQYIGPYIDTSPYKRHLIDPRFSNSVLQRGFKNQSTMFFSFAYLDAERVRGIPADKIVYDECISVHYPIISVDKGIQASTILPEAEIGQKVLAFDRQGNIHEDEIVAIKDQGLRDCYEFRTADGAVTAVTSRTRLATTDGWRFAETIITNAFAEANAARDNAGRRAHENHQQSRGCDLPQLPRLQTAQIQLEEVPPVVLVRKHSTREEEESRLREMVEHLGNTNAASLLPYRLLVSPRANRPEVGNTSVARPVDLGGNCLVVHGRRHTDQRETSSISRRRIFQKRSRTARSLAAKQRAGGFQTSRTQSPCTGQDLLLHPSQRRFDVSTLRRDQALCRTRDAIQGRSSRSGNVADLSLVSEQLHAFAGRASGLPHQRQTALLPERAVFASTTSRAQRSADGTTRKARKQKRQAARKLLRRSRWQQAEVQAQGRSVATERSIQAERSQGSLSSQEAGSTQASNLGLSGVSVGGTAGRQGQSAEVLPSLSQAGERPAKEGQRLEESPIVSIRWLGKHRVFDIETKNHNTFFAGGVAVHNCQGINNEFIPVIRSVTDGSDWRLQEYYGTPLTLDNTIEKLWTQTSQAEWCIRCLVPGCGHINIPSMGYDLIKMIGPIHDGISEKCAGLICVKCAKPLNPRPVSKGGGGRWWHANPEQKHLFPGYHIPQTIMPQHCFKPERWSEIVGRMLGRGNTAPNQFFNETCGESYDVGTKLVSLTELRQACKLPWSNRAEEAKLHAKDYLRRCISVDWSGSGGDGSQSYTTVAALGILPGGRIDVLWGFRITRLMEFDYEVDLIRSARKTFNVHFIAHDCNGVGFAREAMLKSRGEPLDRMMPIMAVGAMREGLMGFKPTTAKRPRAFYTIDKARSIALVCQAIREGYIRFFRWDDRPGEPGLVRDFLAMKEEVVERATGSNLFQIQRTAGLPDDFAQAVVYGCMALWYPDQFPQIGDLSKYGSPSDEENIPDEEVKDLSEWNLSPEEELQFDELE